MDTGAAFSLISKGLANRLGLTFNKGSPRRVVGVEGSSQALVGEIPQARLRVGGLEFEIPSLAVSSSETPLLLLGNDLLSENENFRFLGISNKGDRPALQFLIKGTSRVSEVPCIAGPAALA